MLIKGGFSLVGLFGSGNERSESDQVLGALEEGVLQEFLGCCTFLDIDFQTSVQEIGEVRRELLWFS